MAMKINFFNQLTLISSMETIISLTNFFRFLFFMFIKEKDCIKSKLLEQITPYGNMLLLFLDYQKWYWYTLYYSIHLPDILSIIITTLYHNNK